MITQAVQLSVLVKDMEEAKQFYTDVLGFVIRDEIEFTPEWRYLTVSPSASNETKLELVEAKTSEQREMIGRQAADQVVIMFLSNDIEQDYHEMKARGVVFHGEPKSVPGGIGVGFEDLYGNIFDLYQPTTENENEISHYQPRLKAGNNIALKIPKYKYEETLHFYQEIVRLPYLGYLSGSHAFQFGEMTLWLDCMENYAQQDVWLEITAAHLEAAADYLAEHSVNRRDEVEIHENANGYWISDPAGTILRVNPRK
ncbi:VOC family protein [Gracilibacillus alcaliphilus]|uniref:VOC family protein n=1 Tax=Gracilibacillus alcaliphilus TaxID=1401441 RepID=UPI0030841401|nr:putative enzyme related to lactoylglutathione lyase [Gracilibacillus alcaliphilus]